MEDYSLRCSVCFLCCRAYRQPTRKTEKEVGRAVRRFNTKIAGTPEAIPASDLTMKPKEIIEILNERLIASRKG